MSFRRVAMVVAAFCAAISVLLFVDAGVYTGTYGFESDAGTSFLGRRFAPVLFGLAVMLYLARNASASPVRRAMVLGVAVAFAGIGLTGLWAYNTNAADPAILIAAVVEFGAAIACLSVAQDRD